MCMNPGSGSGVGVGTLAFSHCHNSHLTGADIKTHLGEEAVNQILLTFDNFFFTYLICVLGLQFSQEDLVWSIAGSKMLQALR